VRAFEKLYVGWRQADKTGRERIAAAPLLYLRALDEADALDDASAALVKDLELVGAICRRARRHMTAVATRYARSHVDGAWRSAARAFADLKQAMEDLDDRSDDPHSDPQAA